VQENLTKGEKANLTISITFNSLFTQSIQPQPILNSPPKSQPITSTYEEREDGLKNSYNSVYFWTLHSCYSNFRHMKKKVMELLGGFTCPANVGDLLKQCLELGYSH
jgi:hypothetical protein